MSKDFVSISFNMDRFHRWVETQKKEKTDQCEKIVTGTILSIEHKAKSDAPKDKGLLVGSVHSVLSSDGLSGMVYTGRKYAPYQEWGTGLKVNVPAFVKDMFGVDSMDWKGQGRRKVNIKPHPYLFENARIGYNGMINKLNAIGFK